MGVVELKHGMFAWTDLMAHDAPGSIDFYTGLFGWRADTFPTHPGHHYTLFFQGEHLIAGMGEATDEMKAGGAPPMWNSYILVDDVDATTARVRDLGGEVVMPPMDVLDSGRMSVIRDPSGGHVSLWQAGTHAGATFFNEPNALAWNELVTKDPMAARDFFTKLLGWDYQEMPMPGDWTYHVAMVGDRPNGGICNPPQVPDGVPPYWDVYFAVADVDAMAKRVVELGGRLHVEPMSISVGRFASAMDPQGAVFSLFRPNPPSGE